MQEGGRKAVLMAAVANLGVSVAKFVGYAFTGASSLLAEAVHSVADTSNQLLLLFGAARSERPASDDHPFGYGRERYFWAFVVAVVLFTLGSLFAIHEGVQKLSHPHPIKDPIWAFGILGVAMLLEGMAFRTAVIEGSKTRGDKSWWEFIRHAKSPELPVILLEDFGALMGLIIALICVTLSVTLDAPVWDAIGSLVIGGLLGVIAVVLAIEMKSLLIGEAASESSVQKIRQSIETHPLVRELLHMRTQHLGPQELLVAAKVQLDDALNFRDVVRALNEIEARIHSDVAEARIVYLEPEVAQTTNES